MNNKPNFRKIMSLTIFGILIALILNPLSTFAQSYSAGINPTVIKIEANSPSVLKTPIQIENSSDQTITYSIFLRPFKAGPNLDGDPVYDPALSEDYKDFFKNVSITDLDKPISEITLTPHQKKNLTLRIQISDEIKPQDYYFTAIFLSQLASNEIKTTSVDSRIGIGTNILLTVGTKASPRGSISNFNVPRFFMHGPVEIELEIANLNDYFVSPKGNIVIKNMFGQAVGNIEVKPANILANSNRIITNDNKLIWNEKFLLGIYKANLSVAISDKGPILTQSKLFIAFPIKEIFALVALLLIIVWLYKSAKKKNKAI